MRGQPGADPTGDVLDQRRVVEDQAVAQSLLVGLAVGVPEGYDPGFDVVGGARLGGRVSGPCGRWDHRNVVSHRISTRQVVGDSSRAVPEHPVPVDTHTTTPLPTALLHHPTGGNAVRSLAAGNGLGGAVGGGALGSGGAIRGGVVRVGAVSRRKVGGGGGLLGS
ncbi:hypothetical protein [Saccharothrix variisporea]|uniref:hypothetical protein n=1 Tax=Saccharothrix variisporea TaxID=543527 RepID=UPI001FE88AC9|nr:hypothetical protein [Saccharothrix variisporea]